MLTTNVGSGTVLEGDGSAKLRASGTNPDSKSWVFFAIAASTVTKAQSLTWVDVGQFLLKTLGCQRHKAGEVVTKQPCPKLFFLEGLSCHIVVVAIVHENPF